MGHGSRNRGYTAHVPRQTWLVLSLGIGAALAPTQVHAQADGGTAADGGTCRGDDVGATPLAIFPAVGSEGVALNAQVRAVFPPGLLEGADVSGGDANLSLARCDDEACETTTPVPGHAVVLNDSLVFDADHDLEADTTYEGEAVGEDGNLLFWFRTGMARDKEAPVLSRNVSIRSKSFRGACRGESGVRVEVTTDPAVDDGADGDLEYLLFLTRGPTVTAPTLVSRHRADPGGYPVSLAVLLDEGQAVSPVCFSLEVVDGAGRLGAEGDLLCIDPRERAVFDGICAVSATHAGTSRTGGYALAWVALALTVLARRRHHRRRS